MTYLEADVVATIEHQLDADVATITQDQLDLIDQFHAGGTEAVDRLLQGLELSPAMTVLDVGCGFGGPARQVARQAGCRVVGVDITPAYVDAARALDAATGAGVEYLCTDIADLTRLDFDAGYTMHVQMNVADKPAFFAGIASHLRPGARFAVFEVCRTGDLEPAPPLPWSLDGTDSYLATADELLAAIEGSGFRSLQWIDDTSWIAEWFDQVSARMAGAPAALPTVLHDGFTRMINYAVAIQSGVVSVHRGVFVRA